MYDSVVEEGFGISDSQQVEPIKAGRVPLTADFIGRRAGDAATVGLTFEERLR